MQNTETKKIPVDKEERQNNKYYIFIKVPSAPIGYRRFSHT